MPLLCILGVDRASGLPVTIAWAIVSNKCAALVAASLEIVARAARRASGLEHLHVRVGTHDLVPADGEAMRKVFARIVYLVRCLFHVLAALMPLARAAWRADAGAGASIGEFVALWALVMAMYQATNRNNMIMIAIGLDQALPKVLEGHHHGPLQRPKRARALPTRTAYSAGLGAFRSSRAQDK